MDEIKPIFTYYLSDKQIDGFEKQYQFDKLWINTDARTPVDCAESAQLSVAIIGIAIDTNTGKQEGLASALANDCKSLEEVLQAEYHLGGKYLIIGILGRVPRKDRMASAIHKELLRLLDERFLEIPFGEDDSRMMKWSKKNTTNFYLASFYKYYSDKFRHTVKR